MKKVYKHILLSIATLVLAGFSITSEIVFIEHLKNKLNAYNDKFPSEKVYVQTDKPFYKPGEDIWFSAFVVNGDNTPTSTSDVVYVELIDPKGNSVQRHMLHVVEGVAKGDFHLDETNVGGLYKLTAATQWMKNFPDREFKKDLVVQRVITPRLLMNLDFEKKAYGSGDDVLAKLKVRDLRSNPLTNGTIDFDVKLAGKSIQQGVAYLTGKEEVQIKFQLPEDLNTADGLLNVIVSNGGVSESISRSIPIVYNKVSLQFFPEGGDMVQGMQSKVAFKALNEFGKAADVSGVILDDKDNVVQGFDSFHMGMGAFSITPQAGARYYARIDKPQGITTRYELPLPKLQGFVLSVHKKIAEETIFNIQSPRNEECFLVSHVGGKIYSAEKVKLREGTNEYKLDLKNFPLGVAVFTLFNGEGMNQCERLVFVNKHKGMRIVLNTDKKYYQPGEKVDLKIKTTDEDGNSISANLALSVVDDQLLSFADDKQDNILSSLLVVSELKGEVEEPSFYFKENEPKADLALDYVMMTNGWRRFTWEEIKNPTQIIAYAPEKISNLSGYVVNQSKDKAEETTVTLLELGNKRRYVNLKTNTDGMFTFKNVDPTIPVMLLSDIPKGSFAQWKIILDKNQLYTDSPGRRNGVEKSKDKFISVIPSEIKEDAQEINEPVMKSSSEQDVAFADGQIDVSMNDDVTSLSEVVVVGYSASNASNLTGTVTRIESDRFFSSPNSVESALQGRVAGVMVTPQTATPGANSSVFIRGSASVNSSNDPLIVVDGVPLGTSLSYNFSTAGFINPNDVESITILKSPEATSLYGCMATNGVIIVSTRNQLDRYWDFNSYRRQARYASLKVEPRQFMIGREFYVPEISKKKDNEKRADFRTTVFWKADIRTDESGQAEVSFVNNDATSAFRITAEGIGLNGQVGRQEQVYYTQLPYSLDVKIPAFLSYDDTVRLPIQIKNTSSEILTANLSVSIPAGLKILTPPPALVNVEPQTSKSVWMTFIPSGKNGKFPISIIINNKNFKDEVKKEIVVQSTGFPTTTSYSSKEMDKSITFNINDPRKGSIQAELTVYPDILSELMDGVESILHEPHGCFEQVSSYTFPNVLVLQFMKESGTVSPEIEGKALKFIDDGYKRLMGYEIKSGGFEWFGSPPAIEALTAYGLFEFTEMKKVYPQVSNQMINRTRDWLLSRRNGNGTFDRVKGRYYREEDDDVMNAYIVFALAESGASNFSKEYEHAFNKAIKNKDDYQLALMANASYQLGQMENYKLLIDNFATSVKRSGFEGLRAEKSFTYSYGRSLEVEMLSLWGMALMKNEMTDFQLLDDIAKHVMSKRSNGGFGSTQGTILALKMLTGYAKIIRTVREDGEVELFVNDKLVNSRKYTKGTREDLVVDGIEKHLTSGDQKIRVTYKNTSQPLPYSVNVKWNSKTPNAQKDCKVAIKVSLMESNIKVNETVRLTAELQNVTNEILPMSMAIIGIPAGLSLQPWQLKELQEKKVFDFYEVIDNYLVLYYRGMREKEVRTINLDLKAEIPGTYQGPASSAYLYYASEYKDWVEGKSVRVSQ